MPPLCCHRDEHVQRPVLQHETQRSDRHTPQRSPERRVVRQMHDQRPQLRHRQRVGTERDVDETQPVHGTKVELQRLPVLVEQL